MACPLLSCAARAPPGFLYRLGCQRGLAFSSSHWTSRAEIRPHQVRSSGRLGARRSATRLLSADRRDHGCSATKLHWPTTSAPIRSRSELNGENDVKGQFQTLVVAPHQDLPDPAVPLGTRINSWTNWVKMRALAVFVRPAGKTAQRSICGSVQSCSTILTVPSLTRVLTSIRKRSRYRHWRVQPRALPRQHSHAGDPST